MKLQLLEINRFIERKNIKPVTSSSYYEGGSRTSFNKEGIFSEEIFGRVGSRERKKNYGYINLKIPFVHPEVYHILTSINTDLTKLILGKQNYIISDGQLLKDDDNGQTGVFYFIQNFSQIDLENIKTEKPKHVQYILKNKDNIFIDKYLVLPAGFRDAQVTQQGTFIQHSELNEIYVKLINQASMLQDDLTVFDEELLETVFKNVQRNLININDWLKKRMKGKHGMIRGGMLKKVVDYSARMVITPDNQLDMGYMGIPCQIILKLFEPFFIHYVLKKDRDNMMKERIKKFLDVEELDVERIKKFVAKLNSAPLDVDEITKNIIQEVAQKIVEDRVVVYKRDPVSF